MRGEASPSPVYEGQSGVIAYLLDGPEARYTVALPAPGHPLRAILETFTKAHAAVNHAQAFIDLACELRPQVDLQQVREVLVHTNSTVHHIVGSGSNDPEKYDPDASRETLDAQFISVCIWLQLVYKDQLALLENAPFSTPRCPPCRRLPATGRSPSALAPSGGRPASVGRQASGPAG